MIAPHRLPSLLSYAAAALSLLLGCDPPPKSIGDDELDDAASGSTSGAGTDPTLGAGSDGGHTGQSPGTDDGSTGEPLDPDAPLWSYVLPHGSFLFLIEPMPDGGVVALEYHYDPIQNDDYEFVIARYSPEGALSWQSELESPSLRSIATLPDGSIFVGGTEHDGTATVWRLSPAGAVEAAYSHPGSGDVAAPGHVGHLVVTATGVAYTVTNWRAEPPFYALGTTDLDLVPQWSWAGLGGSAGVAVLPSGEVVTVESQGVEVSERILRTYAADGTPTSEQAVPLGGFVGGKPLVRTERLGESTRLVGTFGTSPLDVVLPFLVEAGTHTAGGEVAVAAANTSGQPGSGTTLVQLDATGAELRSVAIPSLGVGSANASDVVVASDGSVYIGGFEHDYAETDVPNSSRGFLLKLPPA